MVNTVYFLIGDWFQAQTISNFYLAFANELEIIAALNKIDLPGADIEGSKDQIFSLFEMDPDEILLISAKKGVGVTDLLDTIIEKVPAPLTAGQEAAMKLFLFDSWYDKYHGTINLVQVVDGVLSSNRNNVVVSSKTGKEYKVKSVGVLTPSTFPSPMLYPGQMGYLVTNMKNPREAIIGDTLYYKDKPVSPLISIVSINQSEASIIYQPIRSQPSPWCMLESTPSTRVRPGS